MRELLLEIARCRIAKKVREGNCGSPCHEIVWTQQDPSLPFHMPEPWSGDLLKAQMLFVGSNPSIDYNERYPNKDWPEDEVVDFFQKRFTSNPPWIKDSRTLQVFGDRGRSVQYLRVVQELAECIKDGAQPGRDYALTEVVHCKSRRQIGVEKAAAKCAKKYLGPILSHARAPVLIALGAFAETALRDLLDLEPVAGQEDLERDRKTGKLVAFLHHPSYPRRKRDIADVFGEDGLALLRKASAASASA